MKFSSLAISICLSAIAIAGLFFSGLFFIIAILFFDNFNLSNMWQLFVLAYTFLIPPISLIGIVSYHMRPNRYTMMATILFSSGTFAVYLLWTAPGSNGLIH